MKKIRTALVLSVCGIFPLSVQAADATKGLIGTWTLTSLSLAGNTVTCPGVLPLPPGVPDIVKQYAKCNAGEIIQLSKRKSRGVYFEDISNIPTTSPNGTWSAVSEKSVPATMALPAIPAINYLIFDDADNTGDPQAYIYSLSKDKKTLTISKSVGLIGVRYAADLVFTKK